MEVSIWGALCFHICTCSVGCGISMAICFLVTSILYGNDWREVVCEFLIGAAYGVFSGALAGVFLWGMQMMMIAMGVALSVHC